MKFMDNHFNTSDVRAFVADKPKVTMLNIQVQAMCDIIDGLIEGAVKHGAAEIVEGPATGAVEFRWREADHAAR